MKQQFKASQMHMQQLQKSAARNRLLNDETQKRNLSWKQRLRKWLSSDNLSSKATTAKLDLPNR